MEFLFIPLGYLLGSIPFGLLLTRVAGTDDIRKIGSGNIGATNVLRTGNKRLAALTLFLDMLKGAVAVWLSFYSADTSIIFASGFFAVVGHMHSAWLKLQGGKGVATALGVIIALMPPLGLAMILAWLLMAAIFRISSLAALAAFALSPVLSWLWLGDENLALLMCLITALIFWKHKENIKRLLKGEESKISFGKTETTDEHG